MRVVFLLIFVFLLVVTWEGCANNSVKVRLLVSSPHLVFDYFGDHYKTLFYSGWITFIESVAGLLLATTFSFGIMILCFLFPQLLKILIPLFIGSQVIPIIAIAPLLIILFGVGLKAKIIMSALMCFFPIFMNFLAGVKAIPISTKELLFIYGASKKFQIFKVNFPLSMPYIFTGLKISTTLSVIGSIVAEFSGADYGLGKNIFLAAKRLEPELMMLSIIMSCFLGALLFFLVWLLERRIGYWYLKIGKL